MDNVCLLESWTMASLIWQMNALKIIRNLTFDHWVTIKLNYGVTYLSNACFSISVDLWFLWHENDGVASILHGRQKLNYLFCINSSRRPQIKLVRIEAIFFSKKRSQNRSKKNVQNIKCIQFQINLYHIPTIWKIIKIHWE